MSTVSGSERLERVVEALQTCTFKMKVEYDRQQPDAPPDECWTEAEMAWALLDSLGVELPWWRHSRTGGGRT